MNKEELEFLKQSNAIEKEYSQTALYHSIIAWQYSKTIKKLTLNNLLNLHKILIQRLDLKIAGRLRKVDVYVGNRKCLDVKEIKKQLKYLLTIKPSTEEGIRLWHIEFEKIHPFEDGNGRTGRILMNIQRLRCGLPLLIIHTGEEQQNYYKWFQ